MSTIVFHHPYIVSVVLRSTIRFFSHSLILSTNIYILVFPWSLPISANWSIRSWLPDYISFFFYKNYCRRDTYWILMAFIIAASAIIKVCWLHGLYRHLYTKLIYWHGVLLYCIPMEVYWINVPESRILDVMLVIYCAFYIKNISRIVGVTERSRKIGIVIFW